MGTQNGALVNGTKDYNLRSRGGLTLTRTHIIYPKKVNLHRPPQKEPGNRSLHPLGFAICVVYMRNVFKQTCPGRL